MTTKRTDWIQTYTGRQFWPLEPDPEEIVVEDIAHALSMQCRFVGHCNHFYSVAQHSVLVSRACDPRDALWGLLHDAAEAYLVDLCRPVKHEPRMLAYREAEAALQRAICLRFGLPFEEPESVRRADRALLRTEQRDLMKPPPAAWADNREGALPNRIEPWTQIQAERSFLTSFATLTGGE
jgi:uncharacterized protein